MTVQGGSPPGEFVCYKGTLTGEDGTVTWLCQESSLAHQGCHYRQALSAAAATARKVIVAGANVTVPAAT
ncbi:MAG: hypothetical protein WA303_04185, partial [Bradyrhizobium sp.]